MKNPVTYLLTATLPTLHHPDTNDEEVGSIGITIDDFANRKNTLHEPAIPTIVEGVRNFFIEKINYVKQQYAFYVEDESIFDACITLVGSVLTDCISIDQVLCAIHLLSEGIATKLDVLLFFRLVELDAIVV